MADPITDPAYRYATQTYDLDGSTIDFYFNFSDGYISQNFVRAYYKSKIDFSLTQIDPALITFVAVGHVRIPDVVNKSPETTQLVIKRWTEKELPLVAYSDDSFINAVNLSKDSRQAIHDIAEMIDYLADLNEKWEKLNENVLDILETVQNLLNQIQSLLDDIENRLTDIESRLSALENMKYTDLKDTPNALVAGGIPQVNPAGTALVWRTAAEIVAEGGGGGGGVTTFTGLTDTPNAYAGQLNKLVVVGAGALVFKTVSEAVSDAGVTFGIEEAPEDGNEYVRKDGAWAQKTNLIGEAPNDGQEYVRKNQAWAAKTNLIDEAPTDGQQYARQSGTWQVIEGGGGGGVDTLVELTDGPGHYSLSPGRKGVRFLMVGENGWNYDTSMSSLSPGDYDRDANDLLFRDTKLGVSYCNFPKFNQTDILPSAVTVSATVNIVPLSPVNKFYGIGENFLLGYENSGVKTRDKIISLGFNPSTALPGSFNISTGEGIGTTVRKTTVGLYNRSENDTPIVLHYGVNNLLNLSNYQQYVCFDELEGGNNTGAGSVIEVTGLFHVTIIDPSYEVPPTNIYKLNALVEHRTENGVQIMVVIDEDWRVVNEMDSTVSSPSIKIVSQTDNQISPIDRNGLGIEFAGRADVPCSCKGYLEFTLI